MTELESKMIELKTLKAEISALKPKKGVKSYLLEVENDETFEKFKEMLKRYPKNGRKMNMKIRLNELMAQDVATYYSNMTASELP